jgi:hypothetical protein
MLQDLASFTKRKTPCSFLEEHQAFSSQRTAGEGQTPGELIHSGTVNLEKTQNVCYSVIFENKRKAHEATGMLSLDLDRQRRKHIPLRTRNFMKETEGREGYVLLRKVLGSREDQSHDNGLPFGE